MERGGVMGRPSVYTPELGEAICERIYSGESVRQIATRTDMPAASTIHKWASDEKHPFSVQYARACDGRAIAFGERVADLGKLIETGRLDPKRGWHAARLFMWSAERMAPKRYGSRVGVEHSGEIDGGANTGVLVINLPAASYEEACARVGQLPSYVDREADGLAG